MAAHEYVRRVYVERDYRRTNNQEEMNADKLALLCQQPESWQSACAISLKKNLSFLFHGLGKT